MSDCKHFFIQVFDVAELPIGDVEICAKCHKTDGELELEQKVEGLEKLTKAHDRILNTFAYNVPQSKWDMINRMHMNDFYTIGKEGAER